jgi:hypothetical protein
VRYVISHKIEKNVSKVNFQIMKDKKNQYLFIFSLATVFLVAVICHFTTGPRALIDVEFYPAFREAQECGWLCLFSMDRLMVAEVSAPYAGWPPLQPLLVGILGKLGLSYMTSLAIISATSSLMTVVVMGVLLTRWQQWQYFPSVAVFLLFGASLWVSMSTAFAHVMIPLGMSLMALSLAVSLDRAEWNGKGLMAAGLCGFLCGLMNWACYFFVPAVAIVWIIRWLTFGRKNSSQASRKSELRVLAWMLVTTIGCIGAFVLFQFIHTMALQDNTALSAPISGANRISVRAMPTMSNLVGAVFYTIVRFGICLFPLGIFLSWKWKKRGSGAVAFPFSHSASLVIVSSVIAPFLFVACFTGEMAPAAHVFHGRLFVIAAAFLLLVVMKYLLPSRYRRLGFAITCVMLALLSSQSYRFLPPSWITSPSLESKPIGVIAVANYSPRDAEVSPKKLSDYGRTILLQAISWPVSEERRSQEEFLGRSDAWARQHAPFIQTHVKKGEIIVSHQHAAMLATYHFDRDVLSLDESEQAEKKLEKLAELIGWNRIVVLLPAGNDGKGYANNSYLLEPVAESKEFSLFRFVGSRQ